MMRWLKGHIKFKKFCDFLSSKASDHQIWTKWQQKDTNYIQTNFKDTDNLIIVRSCDFDKILQTRLNK